ncbi:MAG: anti-sigma factor [Actinomycetota bacterium]
MESEDRVRDLLLDYHLGHLSAEEAEVVRRHLRGCAGCREALEETARVLDLVPFGVAPAAPPSSLKRRTLERALGEVAPTEERPAEAPSRGERGPARWRRATAAWLAAAAVLAVALFGWAYLDLWLENRQLRAELQDAKREERPALIVAAVEGTDQAPDARGTAVVDPQDRRLALDVYNLPAPPQGHSYRAWLVGRGGESVSLGTMELDESGDGRMTGELPPSVEKVAGLRVTAEPPDTEEMTGPVYLSADLEA